MVIEVVVTKVFSILAWYAPEKVFRFASSGLSGDFLSESKMTVNSVAGLNEFVENRNQLSEEKGRNEAGI